MPWLWVGVRIVGLIVAACAPSLAETHATPAACTAAWRVGESARLITGAGAVFPAPVFSSWSEAYRNKTGVDLQYQIIGSYPGIRAIESGQVTFGASDAPLRAAELDASDLTQFPILLAGVVPVVNLAGVRADDLILDGQTLSKIFLGEITKWNDSAIRRLNPQVKLPSQAISVIHRSDSNSTTFNFTYYLGQANSDWKSREGASATLAGWPVGSGAGGNNGLAAFVANTPGSIGYAEYAYAKLAHMTTTRMVNKDGKTVAASAATFKAAAAAADWDAARFGVLLADQGGANSWPMTSTTWVLMRRQQGGPAAAEALKFFEWAYDEGDTLAIKQGYIPMPAEVKSQVKRHWALELSQRRAEAIFRASHSD